MDNKNILYAYIAVCVLYFFSSLLQLYSLEVIVKPLFLPVLLYYYIKSVNENFQKRVVVSFIFYYIAELLVLLDSEQYYLISVFLFLIPYIILLYFVVKDLSHILKQNDYNKINFIVFFVFAFLIYLVISIFLIIETESIFERFLLYFYGFILLLLAFFSVITYVLRYSAANIFLVMTIMAFIVSDMFYIFIVKVENNWVFKSVNLIAQFLSYYFFVTYSLIKLKEK